MRIGILRSHFGVPGLIIVACAFGFNVHIARAQENNPPATNNQKWNYDEIRKTPEKARLKQNPFENDPDAVLAGGKLFGRNCAECHGLKGEGGKRAPSLLRDEVQQATPGTLFWVLTNGVVWHGMPVWSKLPEPQRWQIVSFLKSFKASGTPEGLAADRHFERDR
jgi:mono/diheme cytochrome c family protein